MDLDVVSASVFGVKWSQELRLGVGVKGRVV